MEPYRSLIDIIDADLHDELKKLYSKEDSLHAKIISDLLKTPEITNQQILERYDVSEGTLNKTLTHVKDLLWNFNAQFIKTSYDDIFVLRRMLLKGKIKNALKFFNSLKKYFEIKQQWDKLDCLYTEGFRYAHITGDEAMSIQLSKERKRNSLRLHEYTMVYSEIVPEMIKLENYKLRKPDLKKYSAYLDNLYKRAHKASHHLLVHNALHLKYLFYARYKNNPQEVFEVITEVKDNAEKHAEVMAEITYAIAINNYVNFLTIYRNFGVPEPYIKQLKKIIHHGGKIAIVNFYYSMLEYSLFEKNIPEVNKWLLELRKTEDTSKLSQYQFIVLAIKAFIEKDEYEFQTNFLKFYEDPTHLNFPDLEVTLRLLEIIVFINRKEGDLSVSKLNALRIFMLRTVDKERYKDERKIIYLLTKINEGRKDLKTDMDELEQSPYRNIYFIVSSIKELLVTR